MTSENSKVFDALKMGMDKLYSLHGVKVLEQIFGNNWGLYQGDCVDVTRHLPDNSIDFTVHSPPFANLYIYSDSAVDMGNAANDEEFFIHYQFLIRELHRITVPGRLCAIHCKDLPLYRNRDGASGLKDFPGMIIREFENEGWTYHSRVTIWKDPVIEMQRTKSHGLLYKNFKGRSEVVRQGMPDYLIVMRKWEGVEGTESHKPVKHDPHVEMTYIGEEPLPERVWTNGDYIDIKNLQCWQRYASPVWFDINQTRVLNYQIARDNQDEKHICPLQLDVIERAIELWTNPGDVVFSPFAGIGSEPFCAVKMGRKGLGVELKKSYFDIAVKNLQEAERLAAQVDLFSFAGIEVEGVA
jgi:DNA modification methylase